ncbi:ABC transporter permease [Thalassobacillus sp. CUG 92003]|uniref:ABC transporter permease n=1 Tax=Thalassobacillus sp. CUG 92003 TaxID=2736641 RepID=UPI0015E666D1|nr:FtsX-like permease family protein [Thalassobacillus sp. CUG 92003]
MRFKDRLGFIRQNMKKNKSRVFMTILATAMGCAFLIVLASVGFGAQRFIVNDIMQDRTVTEISVNGKEQVEEGAPRGITAQDIEKLEQYEDVRAVSRKQIVRNDGFIEYNDHVADLGVQAVHFPSEVESGLTLDEGRMPEADNEIIIGSDMVEALHESPETGEPIPDEQLYNQDGEIKEKYAYEGSRDVIGEELHYKVQQYEDGELQEKTIALEVSGIMEEPARDWQQDKSIFISQAVLSQIEAFTGTPLGQTLAPEMTEEQVEKVKTNDQGEVFQEVKVIASTMEEVKDISAELKNDGYMIYSVTEELDQINLVFAVVKTGLVFVGIIALLIASIGIYNTMSMAVTERTQDIGVMKAIGGHPRMIRSIFLLESGYIGLIGAIVGVAAAYVISAIVNQAFPLIIQQVFGETLDRAIQLSYIPGYLALLCVLLSIGVAMLSGLKPARKATRIDVLQALRRDI